MYNKWYRADETLPEMDYISGGLASHYLLVVNTARPIPHGFAIMRLEELAEGRVWRGSDGSVADLVDVTFWRHLPPAPQGTAGPNPLFKRGRPPRRRAS
jgi:hypothetical protein